MYVVAVVVLLLSFAALLMLRYWARQRVPLFLIDHPPSMIGALCTVVSILYRFVYSR